MSNPTKVFRCDCMGSSCQAKVIISAYPFSQGNTTLTFTIQESANDDYDGAFASIRLTRNNLQQMIEHLQRLKNC